MITPQGGTMKVVYFLIAIMFCTSVLANEVLNSSQYIVSIPAIYEPTNNLNSNYTSVYNDINSYCRERRIEEFENAITVHELNIDRNNGHINGTIFLDGVKLFGLLSGKKTIKTESICN